MSFPTTPSYIGQKWLDGGRVWQWNGTAWQAANNSVFWDEIAGKPTYMSGSTIVSTSAPANPIPGLQWWNPTADRIFIWEGSAWVEPNTFTSYIWDNDAINYINSVEIADAQELEIKTRRAINEFIYGCKADGIWTAIKASCIMAGARTLAGALTPLVGVAPTNVNFISTDYNRKTGLKGDAASKYLNSNRASNADPQNSRHMAVYQTESEIRDLAGIIAKTAIGNASATISSELLTYASQRRFRINSTSTNLTDSANSLYFWGVSRSGASSQIHRFNQVNTSSTITSSAPTSPTNPVGVFSRGGSSISSPSDARISYYSIGEHLDLALLDARVSTLMSAFQTSIP